MAKEDYLGKMNEKSDEQLREIIGKGRDSYEPEAVEAAQEVLTSRGADFEEPCNKEDYTYPAEAPKKPGIGWLIASFFIPIVGIIRYFSKKDEEENAGLYLAAAGAGFIFGLILNS